jgi:hypothetical protein
MPEESLRPTIPDQPSERAPEMSLHPRSEPKEIALYFDDLTLEQKTELFMEFSRVWRDWIVSAEKPSYMLGALYYSDRASLYALSGSFGLTLGAAGWILVRGLNHPDAVSAVVAMLGLVSLGFSIAAAFALRRFALFIHDKEVFLSEKIFGRELREPSIEEMQSEPTP